MRVAEALRRPRAVDSMPFEWVFRVKVPAVLELHKDLITAGLLPWTNEVGDSTCTLCGQPTGRCFRPRGVTPRVVMELMRHSDLCLTIRV